MVVKTNKKPKNKNIGVRSKKSHKYTQHQKICVPNQVMNFSKINGSYPRVCIFRPFTDQSQ
jgi:hypothetical protein